MAAVGRAVSASALASSVGAPCFAPVPCVNVDGLEGSTIPGGVHLARYGGGGDYRVAEPLLSVWYTPPASPAVPCAPCGRLLPYASCASPPSVHASQPLARTRVRRRCTRVSARSTAAWQEAAARLPTVTADSLRLLHGFSESALLPSGAAPTADALECEAAVHLLVSRMPPGGTAGGGGGCLSPA